MISTTIHNDIRKELGISTDEYLIASAIEYYASVDKSGWAYQKCNTIATLFGYSDRTITRVLLNLDSMGLIEKSGKHKIRITQLWTDAHASKKIANGAR